MGIQSVFRRYELKYILSRNQFEKLKKAMENHMQKDKYGEHTICNIYYDTDDYRVIRNSLQKPKYKEKLRLRLYGEASDEATAFLEIKKKFCGVVHKRRISATYGEMKEYLDCGLEVLPPSQIKREIDALKNSIEGIVPKVHISYRRIAYFSSEEENFRMTFDFEIHARNREVSLYRKDSDSRVLPSDQVLLEVKTVGGLPFWLLEFFSLEGIYKQSFSKYGRAYENIFLPEMMAEII